MDFFLQLSISAHLFPLFWMPCTPHPHMPSFSFSVLLYGCCYSLEADGEYGPVLAFVPRSLESPSPFLGSSHSPYLQLSLGTSLSTRHRNEHVLCRQFTLFTHLTLYLFSSLWMQVCPVLNEVEVGLLFMVEVFHDLSIMLKNGWGTRTV